MNYCSVDDISRVYQTATRYQEDVQTVIDGVTDDFNSYMRRDLGYAAAITEIFNVRSTNVGDSQNIWLLKRKITDFAIAFSTTRDWDAIDSVLDPAKYFLDETLGRLTIYGSTRYAPNALRVVYSGGYPPRGDDADAMNCPASVRTAAMTQAIYQFKKIIEGSAGQAQDEERGKVVNVKLVKGLLPEVASTLNNFRRPFGTAL